MEHSNTKEQVWDLVDLTVLHSQVFVRLFILSPV